MSFQRVHLGGNIGKPLLPEIESIKEDDVAVVELSSFQLISNTPLRHIGIIKNDSLVIFFVRIVIGE